MLLSFTPPPSFLYSLASSVLIITCISFYHYSNIPLCILWPQIFLFQFLCLKCASVNWFSQPRSFIFFLLISLFLSSPPLISVCRSPQLWVKQHNSTGESKKKKKERDTMNSNLSAEEELLSISPSLYRSHCPAGLHIMYAHPQSCSETKGQRDRQRKRQMDREIQRGWEKKSDKKRQGSVHSYSSAEVS